MIDFGALVGCERREGFGVVWGFGKFGGDFGLECDIWGRNGELREIQTSFVGEN
jgi:hypothetical protein